MKKVTDPDLCFLEKSIHRDLKLLADLLVYDDDGKERLNERLTKEIDYINNRESLPNAVAVIIDEFLRYGGNTIANVMRRHGCNYKQILFDICERLMIQYDKKMTAIRLERKIIFRTIEFILINADEQRMKNICDRFKVEYSENNEKNIELIISQAMSNNNLKDITLPYLVDSLKNRQELPNWYIEIRKIVQRANIGEGILKDSNPLGLAIRVSDPKYRITYLGVLYIAYMRNKQLEY